MNFDLRMSRVKGFKPLLVKRIWEGRARRVEGHHGNRAWLWG